MGINMRSLKTIKGSLIGKWVTIDDSNWLDQGYYCIGESGKAIYLYYKEQIFYYCKDLFTFIKTNNRGDNMYDYTPGDNLSEIISKYISETHNDYEDFNEVRWINNFLI